MNREVTKAGLGHRRQPNSGVTLTELAIAFLVLSLAIIPIISLLTGGRTQSQMSEHQIYAELACFRAQEDVSTRHFGFLYRSGNEGDMFEEFKRFDNSDGWYDQLLEYRRNAWNAVSPLKSKVTVSSVDKALGIVKVSAFWTDHQSSTRTKEFSYHMLRLRAKRDYGLRSNDADLTASDS